MKNVISLLAVAMLALAFNGCAKTSSTDGEKLDACSKAESKTDCHNADKFKDSKLCEYIKDSNNKEVCKDARTPAKICEEHNGAGKKADCEKVNGDTNHVMKAKSKKCVFNTTGDKCEAKDK